MAPSTTKTASAPKAKATANGGGGVKKGGPGRKGKNNNARNAMAKMQLYCKSSMLLTTRRIPELTRPIHTVKEHRAEFSSLPFKEQQKELGKLVSLILPSSIALVHACAAQVTYHEIPSI